MLIRIDGKVIDLDKVTHIYELITVPALRSDNRREETWIFVGVNEPIKLTPHKGASFIREYYAYKGEPNDISDNNNDNDKAPNNVYQQQRETTSLPIPLLNMKRLQEGISNRIKAEQNT